MVTEETGKDRGAEVGREGRDRGGKQEEARLEIRRQRRGEEARR